MSDYCNPVYYSPSGCLLYPWDFPAKNTGVGCHFLLQGVFLTQGSNLHLMHYRRIIYCWATGRASSPQRSESCSVVSDSLQPHGLVPGILQARILEWVAVPFSRGSSQPRGGAQVSRIAARFFTTAPPGMSPSCARCSCSFNINIYWISTTYQAPGNLSEKNR